MMSAIRYRGVHVKASLYQNGRIGSVQKAPWDKYPHCGLMNARLAMIPGSITAPART
jgi:hypothetical protein